MDSGHYAAWVGLAEARNKDDEPACGAGGWGLPLPLELQPTGLKGTAARVSQCLGGRIHPLAPKPGHQGWSLLMRELPHSSQMTEQGQGAELDIAAHGQIISF